MKITRNSRKYPRIHARGLLKYSAGQGPTQPQVMNIDEISEGGLSFLTDTKLESGTKLAISLLLLPHEDPFDINAVVVCSMLKKKKPPVYRISLRFLEMNESGKAFLREMVVSILKNGKKGRTPRFVLRRH